jgi:hypothetical protein
MKEWIQVKREESSDYLDDKDIFKASVRFVLSQSEIKNGGVVMVKVHRGA